MEASLHRPPRATGPIVLRDFGPTGRRLGTPADCYDGSPWELHRGELVEPMGSKDIHGIVMALLAALFRTHARPGFSVMNYVYCDLSDAEGVSLRAPDVVLVGDLSTPKNDVYAGTPVLAVEIRGTQSKRYLEEKVRLYMDHDWPAVWVVHAERQEVEVLQKDSGSVLFRPGALVPLPAELGKHGLTHLPVAAFFEEREAARFNDGWVLAQAVLQVLQARGLLASDEVRVRVLAASDTAVLGRWLTLASTAPSLQAFLDGMSTY